MTSREDPTWAMGRQDEPHPTWPSGPAPGGPGSRPTAPEGRPSTRIKVADRLGNYVVVRELARGGMGAVYEARHAETAGRYALKTVLTNDRETIERFRREARLLASLDHPSLVRVHTADLDAARPWFAQDLLEGGSLESRVRKGGLPLAEALAITKKVGSALAHAHRRGVIHRDLKPSNVLFDADGEPKLVDFGIARSVMTTSARLTASGEVLGSPGYMAPEQALGLRDEDERTDVYALAALLYAMLVGRPPFTGTTASEVIDQVTKIPVRPLALVCPDVPEGLSAFVGRAMSKDPAARPFDVTTFLRELDAALEAPPAPGGSRRALVGGVILLAALLGAGVLLGLAPDAPPEPPPAVTEAPPRAAEPPAPTEPPPAVSPAGVGWGATLVDGATLELSWELMTVGDPPNVFGFELRQVGPPKRTGKSAEVVLAVARVWLAVPAREGPLAHDTARSADSTLSQAGTTRELAAWLDNAVVGARARLRLDLETGDVERVDGLPPMPRPRAWPQGAEETAWLLARSVDDDVLAIYLEGTLHVFPERAPVDARWRLRAPVHLPFFSLKGEREVVREASRIRQSMRDPQLLVPPGEQLGPGAPAPISVEGEATLDGSRLVRSSLTVTYRPTAQAAHWTQVARMTLTVR